MNEVVVVIGAGSIGQAIARRVSAGKRVVLADLHQSNADAAANVMADAGFEVSTATVEVSSRESIHALVEASTALGDITGVIHAAGVSPSQAPPETILRVDLYGTAVLLEEFGKVVARGGAGVVIASQSGHRLAAMTAEQDAALATTPADELLALPLLAPDQVTCVRLPAQLAERDARIIEGRRFPAGRYFMVVLPRLRSEPQACEVGMAHSSATEERRGLGADVEEWERMIAVNQIGLLYVTHAAVPHLLAAAQDELRGVADIVNISSIAGRQAWANFGVYNMTKFGVNGFTEALRQEVTKQHVRVGVLEPGGDKALVGLLGCSRS